MASSSERTREPLPRGKESWLLGLQGLGSQVER